MDTSQAANNVKSILSKVQVNFLTRERVSSLRVSVHHSVLVLSQGRQGHRAI